MECCSCGSFPLWLFVIFLFTDEQAMAATENETINQVSSSRNANANGESCKDVLPRKSCLQMKNVYACTKNHERMRNLCPRTCGFCPFVPCLDLDVSCKEWAANRGCEMLPDMVGTRCPKSCNLCGPWTPCDNFKCPRGKKCRLDLNGRPICSCANSCRQMRQTGPVCGSNGRTYNNFCELVKDECKQEDFITVKYYGQCIKYEPCSDNADPPGARTTLCNLMKKSGACTKNKELMQFYCARTCKLCRQLAPSPSCSTTKYGCCWDKDISAKGKYGEGCGDCKDKPLCKYFNSVCGKATNVNFMRKYCPVSCHYCITPAQLKRGYR